ncbi:flavocytochrome c [Sediminispirochaeta bajacaliforniensis]|uniref:flavocytochrome c n=1 Tax=Sediminispirochaeta bajacaliforniensis TaxID=148 RepID=UPI0003657D2D|nr:flavocytochrome c [Sediminispirochaeta bajacaliforniensis]
MKRLITLSMVILLVFMTIGCGKKEQRFTAGTYEGAAPGIHGDDVVLEVTVDDTSIKEIKVIQNNETPGVSDAAFDRIPKAIIEGQTLAVDTVSGATYSSKAIIGAVTAALQAAGADIAALSAGKAESDADAVSSATKVMNADIVVVGAGGAGLAAAVSANQKGATVIVLEKMPQVGGNTIISGAAYNAVDPSRQKPAGIEDSIEKHYTQTYEGGDELGNPVLIHTMVENAYPTLQWLESLGMEFKGQIFTVLGGLWPRAHKPVKPLGTGYIETYMNYIKQHDGITLLTDTRAVDLYKEDGRVSVVKATGPDATIVAQAHKAVILTTGGFGANIELRDKYNKIWPTLTTIKTTNHPGATGDGLALAEKVGADLVGMEYIQLLPMGDPDTGSLSGNIELGVENRIFVNKDGKRFVDEGARRDVMTKALFDQEDAFMWVILDGHCYPTTDIKNNFNETMQELLDQGRAYKADSLEELADEIGVDADNLKASVAEFNKAVETGGPDAFGRTLFADKIDQPPYYAGARKPTVHHTMGGIKINEKTQVIDKDGNVIPGLYAAGETTGGIHGSNRLGGNALVDINVFGKIAGENAAAESNQE